MKKLIFVLSGLLFLAFASAPVAANHEPTCRLIAQTKIDVASWDKSNATVWEYVKDGYKFDALLKWTKARVAVPATVDGILITYLTNPTTGDKVVLWTVSPNGQCVEMTTFQKLSRAEFDKIAGVDI